MLWLIFNYFLGCLITVHQNSCKDQVSECVKQKYGKVCIYI